MGKASQPYIYAIGQVPTELEVEVHPHFHLLHWERTVDKARRYPAALHLTRALREVQHACLVLYNTDTPLYSTPILLHGILLGHAHKSNLPIVSWGGRKPAGIEELICPHYFPQLTDLTEYLREHWILPGEQLDLLSTL